MLNITAFLSYVFATTFTPGPNNIMAMSNGNHFGYKKAFQFILGVTAGFAVIMLLSCYLNLMLANLIPSIKPFMNVVGVIYMLYLAVKILKSNSNIENKLDEKMNTFKMGMILQFINPKAILYGVTATASFVVPYYQSPMALILFSILLAFVAFLATSCWALFGSLFQKVLSKHRKTFNIVMALLLIYSAVSMPEIKNWLGF